MKKEQFIIERTRIISEMLDNPNSYGIYPTTKCFNELDALFDKVDGANTSHKLALNLAFVIPRFLYPIFYRILKKDMVKQLSKKHGEQFIDDVMDTFGMPTNLMDKYYK